MVSSLLAYPDLQRPCPSKAASAAPAKVDLQRVKVPLELEEVGVPLNTYGGKDPLIAKVVSVKTLTGPRASGEVCHITLQTDGRIPFVEGQSYGIIPPGTTVNSKGKEVPHKTRLYTIASTRYGDNFDGKTASLCVRRARYVDPETQQEDPAKKGICSTFLCDAKPGQEVMMTGPTGKILLLPQDPSTNLILVATGSGIAPYRTFWRRFFIEDVPNYKFTGLAWLFMGAAHSDGKLYDDEIQEVLAAHPQQFRVDYALSREGPKNKRGGKLYIQDKVEEHADEVFDLLDKGAHIYFCGLKGMMPGIFEMLKGVCAQKELGYDTWYEGLKERGQFHIEVY
ncbi:hypothetical protein N2152v2_001705 [Parachlorella kessleri]